MTGTSLDGLDAALVAIDGRGLDMRAKFIGMTSLPLGDLRDDLRHFAGGGAAEPIGFLRAARKLGELHADAIAALCEQEGCKQLDFAVAHGQTIWHAPGDREASKTAGLSWQLFDPWPIVRRMNVPVCYDLRQADLIAGGQGAPITPIADWVLFRSTKADRFVANLGGICNITSLPRGGSVERVRGEDVGPCNLLIDAAVRIGFPGQSFDKDGSIARRGSRLGMAFHYVMEAPFFQRKRPATTGREDFTEAWVRELAKRCEFNRDDFVASSVDAVARVVLDSIIEHAGGELVVAGGGAKNPVLMECLRERSQSFFEVRTTDELGVPVDAREAMEFAVLGALSQDGVPITLPQVTGATNPGRAGAWVYP